MELTIDIIKVFIYTLGLPVAICQIISLFLVFNEKTFKGEWHWIKFRVKSFFKKEDNKIDYWKGFAEALVIRYDISLENVMIHNFGMFGFAGRGHDTFEEDGSPIGYTCYVDDYGNKFLFKVERYNKPYIVVPEIKCWWTFRAWIHEIGHFTNGHYRSNKDTYIKEYEAEKYCLKMIKKCKVDDEDFVKIKNSAYKYLSEHIVEHFTSTEYYMSYSEYKKMDFTLMNKRVKRFLPQSYLQQVSRIIVKSNLSVRPNENGRIYLKEILYKNLPKY